MSVISSSPDEADRKGGAVTVGRSLVDEARRLLGVAREREVPMRLLGGMAIRIMLGPRMDPRFHREINDLDFITTRKAGREVDELLEREGWQPNRRFNTLNGARRLLFEDPGSDHKIDVFVDSFEMSHVLPLAERLHVRDDTLPAVELLMTKLQIVTLNEKDRNDIYALLDALEIAEHDEDAINVARMTELTSVDWGLEHTFELNLGRLREQVQDTQLPPERQEAITRKVDAIGRVLEQAPKSRGWRLRAKIGERKRWYEEVEEVDR